MTDKKGELNDESQTFDIYHFKSRLDMLLAASVIIILLLLVLLYSMWNAPGQI